MSNITVQKAFTIGGKVVEKIGEIGHFTVYRSSEEDNSELVMYICNKSDEVFKKIHITSDCSQNTPWIDTVDFTDM